MDGGGVLWARIWAVFGGLRRGDGSLYGWGIERGF